MENDGPFDPAIANRTKIIQEAIENIENNRLVEVIFLKASEALKSGDFPRFASHLQELQDLQELIFAQKFKELQDRVEEIGDEEIRARFEHQKKTLQELSSLKNGHFACLRFFAKKELSRSAFKFLGGILPIHQQMIQVCENSVALIFIGIIRSGKSTLAKIIVGENVMDCFDKNDLVTTIPVRYLHDPDAIEPTMLVPFAPQLNKVVRSIKLAIDQSTREAICAQIFHRLRNFVDKIDRGLVNFRDSYSGAKDALEASIDIHDIFRLAVQDCFDPSLALELPLDWNQGLDGFLTVSVKFLDSFGISSSVKFSVIDTPGVNDMAVARLKLGQVISNAVEVSHYVAFTVQPHTINSVDHAKLKRIISRLFATPTLVLATDRDTLKEAPQDLADYAQNIADSLREGDVEYPLGSVYIVSGKRKLLGDQMMNFINKHHRKPELHHEDPPSEFLGENWGLHVVAGYEMEEKLEEYEDTSLKKVKRLNEKMLRASHIDAPLDRMANTLSKYSTALSCNTAIQKSLEISRGDLAHLEQVLHSVRYGLKDDLGEIGPLLETFQQVVPALQELLRDVSIEQ